LIGRITVRQRPSYSRAFSDRAQQIVSAAALEEIRFSFGDHANPRTIIASIEMRDIRLGGTQWTTSNQVHALRNIYKADCKERMEPDRHS
jgi:hypothetical protein